MSTPLDQVSDTASDDNDVSISVQPDAALAPDPDPPAEEFEIAQPEPPIETTLPPQDVDETPAPDVARARRFGPKRSKSATLRETPSLNAVADTNGVAEVPPADVTPAQGAAESPQPEEYAPAGGHLSAYPQTYEPQSSVAEIPAPAAGAHITGTDQTAPAEPAGDQFSVESAAASRTRSSRVRPRRRSAPPSASAQTAVEVDPIVASGALPPLVDSEALTTSASVGDSETPAVVEPARRRVRPRRSRAKVVSAPAATPELEPSQLNEIAAEYSATAAAMSDVAVGAAPESTVYPVTDGQPPLAAEAVTVDGAPGTAAPSRSTRARRSRRRTSAGARVEAATTVPEPVGHSTSDERPDAMAATADLQDVDAAPATLDDGIKFWPADEPLHVREPGGDLDGTEALARALLEMFPALDTSSRAPVETASAQGGQAVEDSVSDGVDEADGVAESPVLAGEEDVEGTDAAHRRGRRGRRGGRGRRRGAEHVSAVEGSADVSELLPSPIQSPVEESVIVPEQVAATPADMNGRQERPWRERGPQRRWGRVFPRDVHTVTMPPPKPGYGGRFAPIPQAQPSVPDLPPAAPAAPSLVAAAGSTFVMPDLRTNEPLAPGETRTERLLEIQTRLLSAMLETQARQIESLTASVANLHQAVRDVSLNSKSGFRPRTAIFVDAPNVCYAAENARVNIDFARMLKYFARDRHLVHALSYSPIIDDVREGIRYETQRFVAPFLRSGYKLITKPLKRFSDGSAKGNFDLELALDILTMADRLDVVVLVSGDSDFECVIEHIQSRGVRVEVVAFASNVSTELVNIADTFIDIMQHIEHFRGV